jgi:hypothetical protein
MKKCLDCDARYGDPLFFLYLSDRAWERIGAKRDDYLCPSCIVNRLIKSGFSVGYLSIDEGRQECSVTNSTLELKYFQRQRG